MSFATDLRKRVERLIITIVAKKYIAWATATALLVLYVGKDGWAEWLTFTVAVFCIDAYSKKALYAAPDSSK